MCATECRAEEARTICDLFGNEGNYQNKQILIQSVFRSSMEFSSLEDSHCPSVTYVLSISEKAEASSLGKKFNSYIRNPRNLGEKSASIEFVGVFREFPQNKRQLQNKIPGYHPKYYLEAEKIITFSRLEER
jgi:hypothetical protein